MRLLLALMLPMTLLGCLEDKPITGTMDRVGQAQTITVHLYKTNKEVTEAYKVWMGKELKDSPNPQAYRKGFAIWKAENTCEIHAKRITRHAQLETLGHELYHCLKGQWHK